MKTVYIIASITGNGEQYEDYRESFNVEGVYTSKELAEEAMKALPTTVPCRYEVVYEWSEEHQTQIPKIADDGSTEWESTDVTAPTYYIIEREIIQ